MQEMTAAPENIPQAFVHLQYGWPYHQVTLPDGRLDTLVQANVAIGVFIILSSLLDNEFTRKRSLQEDQLGIFKQVEANINRLGMRGHDCVLRFICELNSNKFAQSSIIGHILKQMFTPATSPDSLSMMDDYFEADLAGQKGTNVTEVCESMYSSCGVSVFAALENFQSQWGLPAVTPAKNTDPASDVMTDITLQEENDADDVITHEDELQSLNGL